MPATRDTTKKSTKKPVPMKPSDSTMQRMQKDSSTAMMSGPLGIPMDRMGSGTTWIPDAVTLPSRHTMIGKWDVMAHGFLFAQYDRQSGRRGDEQVGSLNWIMLMASRELAGAHFQARTMLSLDPAGVTARGYPLLLQSGESYRGKSLHDRQHPHDFFMEIGALYQRAFNDRLAWSLYAAPSGEPALGPVAFMHRPSAMDNPSAPIAHHWQDATHVSFGVITAGVFTNQWQLEASTFNGREPDERRWNFDPIKLDSYSGRVTFNPTMRWSLSAGAGYLKSPEALHPQESLHRYTASVLHGTKVGTIGQSATALIWGANRHGGSSLSHSVLAENETIFDEKNTVFGRAELVQKSADDLALDTESPSVLSGKFNVATTQLGYIRELTRINWATVGAGAAATLNFVPDTLERFYGSLHPVGILLFIRVRPFHLGEHGMKKMVP
ncbi:MAG: hypothetical protein ABR582_11695 [Gemmatimonadaceae bacterium]